MIAVLVAIMIVTAVTVATAVSFIRRKWHIAPLLAAAGKLDAPAKKHQTDETSDINNLAHEITDA